MFILRAIFWIAVLAFLLPTGERAGLMDMGSARSFSSPEDQRYDDRFRAQPAAYERSGDLYVSNGEPDRWQAEAYGPAGSSPDTALPSEDEETLAGTGDKFAHALRLAQATGQAIGDLMEFCDRNPQVCDTAVTTAYFVRAQAEHYGLKGLELIGAAVNEGVDDPAVIWRRVQSAEGPVPLPRPQRY
jgi:hypothetical protein